MQEMTIVVRRRPWWMWLLVVFGLAVEIVVLQTAIASAGEAESRASVLSWILAVLIGVPGVWLGHKLFSIRRCANETESAG